MSEVFSERARLRPGGRLLGGSRGNLTGKAGRHVGFMKRLSHLKETLEGSLGVFKGKHWVCDVFFWVLVFLLESISVPPIIEIPSFLFKSPPSTPCLIRYSSISTLQEVVFGSLLPINKALKTHYIVEAAGS